MSAPRVIKGAIDGAAITAYVKKVLVPELSPGTVVILGNPPPQERRSGTGNANRSNKNSTLFAP